MHRDELAHIIGAAANITGEQRFVVIGSQAILGSHADAPASLLVSMEADIYPLDDPQGADEIDGALGDGSQFHRTFGYYAHGVGPETAKAPLGWQDRLVELEVAPRPGSSAKAVALCLEPHDLILAKCAAGRERDWEFALDALRGGLVGLEELLSRIDALPIDAQHRDQVRAMIEGVAARI